MAFGVLPEISRMHQEYKDHIINFFCSKWCLKFERVLLEWVTNLPQINALTDEPRPENKKYFQADRRELCCG